MGSNAIYDWIFFTIPQPAEQTVPRKNILLIPNLVLRALAFLLSVLGFDFCNLIHPKRENYLAGPQLRVTAII